MQVNEEYEGGPLSSASAEPTPLNSSFYQDILAQQFPSSQSAIAYCRELCANYGFTIKQEQSTHKNIYVYCSREGMADSKRKPKPNPQRRRPSARCQCRWRIVLCENEEDGLWRFRETFTGESYKHNHLLGDPAKIAKPWPPDMVEYIYQLARHGVSTNQARTKVRARFPDVFWDERRFYNRLTEERKRVRQIEAVERTHQLYATWSRLCMVAASSDAVSDYVQQELDSLVYRVCQTIQLDPSQLSTATTDSSTLIPATAPTTSAVTAPAVATGSLSQQQQQQQQQQGTTSSTSTPVPVSPWSASDRDTPTPTSSTFASTKSMDPRAARGYIAVDIPARVQLIKMHTLRQLGELDTLPAQRRQRFQDMDEDEDGGDESDSRPRKRPVKHPQSEEEMSSVHTTSPVSTHSFYTPSPNESAPPGLSFSTSAHHHHHHHLHHLHQHQQQQHHQHHHPATASALAPTLASSAPPPDAPTAGPSVVPPLSTAARPNAPVSVNSVLSLGMAGPMSMGHHHPSAHSYDILPPYPQPMPPSPGSHPVGTASSSRSLSLALPTNPKPPPPGSYATDVAFRPATSTFSVGYPPTGTVVHTTEGMMARLMVPFSSLSPGLAYAAPSLPVPPPAHGEADDAAAMADALTHVLPATSYDDGALPMAANMHGHLNYYQRRRRSDLP